MATRTSRRAALFSGAYLVLLAGCAAADPRPDYDEARQIITERTGVDDVQSPDAREQVDARIDQLLDGGLTVDEAVQLAFLNNPEFAAAFAEIGASRADLAQSALFTNPTLSLGLQLPEGGGVSDLTVGWGQQIADLWQIPVRKQVAQAELERTILAVGQRAVELAAEVRIRCYRLMALEQAVAYTAENLALVQRSVALTEAQHKAGEVSEFDVNLARSSVLDVQEQLISAKGQLESGRADLAQILGLSAQKKDLRISGMLPSSPQQQPSIDILLDRALDERFDVRLTWLAAQKAEAALRLECRRFLPDVQLGFAFERMERRGLPGRKILADTARESIANGALTAPSIQSRGQRALENSQVIEAKLGPTLALALPVLDQNQEQIAKARIRVLQARKEYDTKVQAVAADVRRAAVAADTSAELLRFQQTQALSQAQATVDGAERRYSAGEEGVLALIEAQDALVKRRSAYVSALRDYAVALAQLESASGGRPLFETAAPASQPAAPLLMEAR